MKRTWPLALVYALGACSLTPHYERPGAPIPAAFPQGDPYPELSERQTPALSYRDVFKDARLVSLVDQALANNRDLRVAIANIAAARARYNIQRAELLPEIDAGVSARYTDANDAAAAANAGAVGRTPTGGQSESFTASVGVTAFELDLFGRVRALSGAALQRYLATEAAARATKLTLAGDVASAWLSYAADTSLLEIAQDTANAAEESLKLTKLRLDSGVAPATDYLQAQTVFDQARADLAASRTARAQDLNALNLLVGSTFDPSLLPGRIEDLVDSVADAPVGLDSRVLLSRPDVTEAEFALKAANFEVGAARAALFPTISLTATGTGASGQLSRLFDPASTAWAAGPSIAIPLLDWGARGAAVRASRADRAAALAGYERTVQSAFREVADALARTGTIDEQTQAQRDLVAATGQNFALSQMRYRGGIESFLQTLDAQRSLYAAQRALVSVELARTGARVTLYRALGADPLLNAPIKR